MLFYNDRNQLKQAQRTSASSAKKLGHETFKPRQKIDTTPLPRERPSEIYRKAKLI